MRHHHKAIISSLLLTIAMPASATAASDQRDAYQRAQQQQALQLKQQLTAPQIARQPAISRYRPKPKPLIKPTDVTPVYQRGYEPKPVVAGTSPVKVVPAAQNDKSSTSAFHTAQQQQRLQLNNGKLSAKQASPKAGDSHSSAD